MDRPQGYFISFEGGEGSGKTTQIRRLHNALKEAGRACVLTREPGGSPQAEAVRQLLLTGAADKWHPVSEALLFQAARVEHAELTIRPALERGELVLCDRFIDSTVVYQGIGKGLGVRYIADLHRMTLGTFTPDKTVLFDIDPAIGLERAGRRTGSETRFESMDIGFHHEVRNGFLRLAQAEPDRFIIIDAAGSESDVYQKVCQSLSNTLKI